MPVKKCRKCGAVKVLDEFYFRNDSQTYRTDCKSCRKKTVSQYKKDNKGVVNAYANKRRTQKLHATPAWADEEVIKEIYSEAQRLQEALGIDLHVDHIIPLQGELVCGLHVASNLQVIPAALNVRKSNKFKVQ